MTARQRHHASSPWGSGVASFLHALALDMRGLEWQDDAACRDVGGDAWYPAKGRRAPLARSICEGCPVRVDCLEDALDRHDQYGIWGGYNIDERQKIQQQRDEVAA